jgi:hypothetical protein
VQQGRSLSESEYEASDEEWTGANGDVDKLSTAARMKKSKSMPFTADMAGDR